MQTCDIAEQCKAKACSKYNLFHFYALTPAGNASFLIVISNIDLASIHQNITLMY